MRQPRLPRQHPRSRRSSAVAVLATMALLAGACGGDTAGTDDADDVAATASASPTSSPAGDGDGAFMLGHLLPETGPLASLGPGVIAATKLAVEDLNAAGGVLGSPVELSSADSAGDPNVATEGVQRMINEGVDAVVGAVSSAISLAVIDTIKTNQVAQCSGSNTSKTFTDLEDDGYYIRTAPSNVLQASVLANEILEDGATTVSLLVRADDYGASIGGALEEDLTEQGATVAMVDYEPESANFDGEIDQALADDPGAVVVIAFDEGAQILRGLIERGAGPDEVNIYGTDGMAYATLAEQVAPGEPERLEGMKGTQTSSAYSPEFDERLREYDPSLEVTNFGPYFYDCVVVLALAAETAGTGDAAEFKDHLADVTRGGEECETYEVCKQLISDGVDIDYQGVSGPMEFVDVGEPSVAIFDVVRFDGTGAPEIIDTVQTEPAA